MMKTDYQISTPKFRDGVMVNYNNDSIFLIYREQSCDLEFEQSYMNDVKILLDILVQGKTKVDEIGKAVPAIQDHVSSIIAELDRNGLLNEAELTISDKSVSGKQLYHEVLFLFDNVMQRSARSQFYNMLVENKATCAQLIGYAIEYYHLTKLAPGILGPMLAKVESRKSRQMLQDFLRSELYHDKMLEKSLTSVGVTSEEIDMAQPLPSTFAICASLGVYAQQHPISLKAALFMFEKPYPEFNSAFKKRCEELDMPRKFYEPILKHAEINEDGDHGSISEMLLDDMSAISYEEKNTVKKHIAILCESLVIQENEIINYYGTMKDFKPRIFL